MKSLTYFFYKIIYVVKKILLKLILSKESKFVIVMDDLISNEIMLKGYHEKYEINLILEILKNSLPKNLNMIDVGANIGNHSVYFGKYFKEIYSFEPNPILFKILESNVMLNKMDHKIRLFNFALGEKIETKKYLLTSKNFGGSGFFDRDFKANNHFKEYYLKIKRGDSIGFNNIGFIKIDTEGYDFNVIKGLIKTIRKFKPIITFEVHPFGKDNNMIIEYLLKNDYKYIYHITDSRFSLPKLKRINEFESGRLYNLIICSTKSL